MAGRPVILPENSPEYLEVSIYNLGMRNIFKLIVNLRELGRYDV
jgi:hypothetical protein